MNKRILIAGGGTGGHVYPALAIIEALRTSGSFEFLYVGGRNGVETRIVPNHGIPMETIWISGFARSFSPRNLLFPFKLLSSIFRSWRIVKRFKPDVAVGTGGYVSGPILFAASRAGTPLLIQEQDAFPGVTTRLLARFADRICLSFEGAEQYLQAYRSKVIVTGNPVRKGLDQGDRQAARAQWGLAKEKKTVFVFGGSQGARSINLAITELIPQLVENHAVQFLWQTGESQYDSVRAAMGDAQADVKIIPYVADMQAAYAAADIIVCRAGASSLAELALVAKPAILIPYPFAAGNHQAKNSQLMSEAGAALMVSEGEGWQTSLAEALELLLNDEPLRLRQSTAWRKIARPDAAQRICDEITALIK